MLTFERCHPQHFQYIVPAAVQMAEYAYLQTPGVAEQFTSGICLSAWVSGKCIGAAGVITAWKGRGEAWTLFGEEALGKYMLPCVRKMLLVLNTVPYTRVDMTVKDGNGNGHALAAMLGFKLEAKLEKWNDGVDYYMYKRIKP